MRFNKKKEYLIAGFLLFLSFFFLTANFCSAAFLKNETKEDIKDQTIYSANDSYALIDDENNIYILVQVVINAFLAIVGVLLLIYMLYAGYTWMTAHGEEEKVEKAKDTLKRAIIGAIIIVAAYAISVFVMSRLEAGTLKGGGGENIDSRAPVD